MSNENGIWIRPFSDFQVKFLRELFQDNVGMHPTHSNVTKIATTEYLSVIVEYTKWGRIFVKEIKYDDTSETFLEKDFPNFKPNS